MRRDCFDQVYEEYHKLVIHVAFDILQDYNLAQDVCQEVFVKLHQKIERLDESKIKGWILRNAQRKAIDFWRKTYRKKEIPVVKETMERASIVEYLLEIENECRRKGFRNFLLDRLRDQDPMWYDLMVRVVVENEPVEEVAKDYGMSVMSLRMRIGHARRWLNTNYYRDYREL